MHAIALNVADLPVVATKLGTTRIGGVEVIERPMVLEVLRPAGDHQVLCHCDASLWVTHLYWSTYRNRDLSHCAWSASKAAGLSTKQQVLVENSAAISPLCRAKVERSLGRLATKASAHKIV